MEFEISIQGPLSHINYICSELTAENVEMRRVADLGTGGTSTGTVVFWEYSVHLNDRLKFVSKLLDRLDSPGPGSGFEINVRNLASSEPTSGSAEFTEPFSPVPGLTVQPWDPTQLMIHDPATIIIDPSHAFGTGKHPSTRLCLAAVRDVASKPPGLEGLSVMDVGCGTGLLSIYAANRGAKRVLGVEINPAVVRAAKRNKALNELTERIEIRTGSLETVHEHFDLVIANLAIAVLLRMGGSLADFVKPGGRVVTSGFARAQAHRVRQILEDSGLAVIGEDDLEGWSALVLQRTDDRRQRTDRR